MAFLQQNGHEKRSEIAFSSGDEDLHRGSVLGGFPEAIRPSPWGTAASQLFAGCASGQRHTIAFPGELHPLAEQWFQKTAPSFHVPYFRAVELTRRTAR